MKGDSAPRLATRHGETRRASSTRCEAAPKSSRPWSAAPSSPSSCCVEAARKCWHIRPCSKRRSSWRMPSLKLNSSRHTRKTSRSWRTSAATIPRSSARRARAARIGADAVDLNLGCPQRVAYAGHYGSYLMKQEDRELVKSIVRAMRRDTPPHVVVCVKIRLMDTQPDTLQLVEDLRDSGAQVVALQRRRRAVLVCVEIIEQGLLQGQRPSPNWMLSARSRRAASARAPL